MTQHVIEAAIERPRRVEDTTSRTVADMASIVFQPERLDVLVHLRAFESLDGADSVADDGVDWLATSDALAADDVEPTVGELAAGLVSDEALDHEIVFGSGGRLVAGATSAAASIYGGVPMHRRDVGIRGFDRSQSALAEAGFTPNEIRGAAETWLRRDPRAALVVVDHDARCADAALTEIERRYEVFHSEFDHLSAEQAIAAGLASGGSLHLLAVRVNDTTIDAVVNRHREAVVGSFRGRSATTFARAVYDSRRPTSSSPSHARALRTRRRQARQARVIAGLRALKS